MILTLRRHLSSKLLLKYLKTEIKNLEAITDPLLLEKADKLKQAKPFFDRLIDIDAEHLSRVPWIFKPIEPLADALKVTLFDINLHLHLPWPSVIILSCVFIRMTLLPLLYTQIKRVTKIAPVSPALIHIKDTFKSSNLPLRKRALLALQAYRFIFKQHDLKILRMFIYNVVHFPIILTMVYAIRKLLADPTIGSISFLHLPALSGVDPYLILPALTIILHYLNFQRYITKENAHTLVSRIRSACQILVILWFPWLSSWPSGIVLYMFTNALLSTIQSTLMARPSLVQKMNPKLVYYGYILSQVEYDVKGSSALMESIKTGNESLKKQAITEEALQNNTGQLIKYLNSTVEYVDDDKKR